MSDKLKVSIFFFIGILVGLTGIVYADTTLVRGRGYNYGDMPPTHAYGDFDAIGSDGIIVEQTVGTIDDWELQFAVDMDYVNANITPSSSSVWVDDPISGDGTVGDPVTIAADAIDDTHIDFGTGAGQVSSDDVPQGSVNLYNVTQNLWETITGDSGSRAASSATATLNIVGGAGITTGMSGDTMTVTNDYAISSATTEVIFNNGGVYVGNAGFSFVSATSPSLRIGTPDPFVHHGATLIPGYTTNADAFSMFLSQSHSADAGVSGNFAAVRSRGTTASPAIVQDDDVVGTFSGFGYDGTDYEAVGQMVVEVDGTPGDNDMPGRIVFKTTPDGGTSLTEVLRLDSNQDGIFSNSVTVGNSIFLAEQAAALIDVAGYGQLSIKNDTPNTLWFTDDAGTDYQCALPNQNLWATVTADLGNTTANSLTDNLSIVGGPGIGTGIVGDTLTITNTVTDTNTDNEIISVGQSTAQGIVTLNLGIHCPMAVVKTGTANYAAVYISQWTPDLTADVITFTLYVNGGATDTWTTSAGAAGLSVSGASVSEAISQGDIVQIYGQVTTQNGSLDTIKAQSWSVNELITP